jgi:hypothetical protein
VRNMESATQNQFSQDEPVFFVSRGAESLQGPMRPSELLRMIEAREISWLDPCYREGESEWSRICDHSVFRVLGPGMPESKPRPRVVPPPLPREALLPKVSWFLFQNDSQSGPYPAPELFRMIRAGQVSEQAFVWQEAFADWVPVRDVPAFSSVFVQDRQKESHGEKPSDRRASPRRPLVARIYLTNGKEVSSGMCRDISIGGMQVLTDAVPGKTGDQIRLNVMPPASTGLRPFVALGVIVRVLEDQKGFSFRFTEINEEAKQSIERYIT